MQGSSETAVQSTFVTVGTDEQLLGTDIHHRLLVKPDAFHISVIFQPMLAFIDRVTGILPSGFEAARASSAVLDEFVLKVYLPQLEEKVSLLFHQATTGKILHLRSVRLELRSMKGPEAFIPDPSSTWLSTEPLVNVSVGNTWLSASNVIDDPTGRHNYNGSHQLFMRNAQDNAVPQGELCSFNPYGHYPILPAL